MKSETPETIKLNRDNPDVKPQGRMESPHISTRDFFNLEDESKSVEIENNTRDTLEILISRYLEEKQTNESLNVGEFLSQYPQYAKDLADILPTVDALDKMGNDIGKTGSVTAGGTLRLNLDKRIDLNSDQTCSYVNLTAGMTLGKYKLIKPLGAGGVGTVWLSEHPELSIPVAVKVLKNSTEIQTEKPLERFAREGRIAALINHGNVVRVFDAGCENDFHYLVMEYVDGGSVKDLLLNNKNGIPVEQAMNIAFSIANAIEEIASHGIVHRDVKPANIMLTGSGVPKLADLGLARDHFSDADNKLTMTGVGMGTPVYMPPEQAVGGELDVRSDIYALAATIFHMLCGKEPFSGQTPYDIIIQKNSNKALPDLTALNKNLPPNLARVLKKAMAKDPNDRYQTINAFRNDLELATGISSVKVMQFDAQDTKNKTFIYGGIAAAALLIGLLIFYLAPDNKENIIPAQPEMVNESAVVTQPEPMNENVTAVNPQPVKEDNPLKITSIRGVDPEINDRRNAQNQGSSSVPPSRAEVREWLVNDTMEVPDIAKETAFTTKDDNDWELYYEKARKLAKLNSGGSYHPDTDTITVEPVNDGSEIPYLLCTRKLNTSGLVKIMFEARNLDIIACLGDQNGAMVRSRVEASTQNWTKVVIALEPRGVPAIRINGKQILVNNRVNDNNIFCCLKGVSGKKLQIRNYVSYFLPPPQESLERSREFQRPGNFPPPPMGHRMRQ